MGQPYLNQNSWRVGDNDNSDPDLCTWRGSCGSSGYTYSVGTPFMLRFTISNTGSKTSGSTSWSLYYNTTNSVSGATQVTTSSGIVRIVNGTPTDGAATNSAVCAGTGTRANAEYNDANDSITYELVNAYYCELQFCVAFQSGASGTYYFFLRTTAGDLNEYSANGAQATAPIKEPLVAAIDGSGLVTANLKRKIKISVALDGTGLLVGGLDYAGVTEPLASDITGSALLVGNLTRTIYFDSDITGSALLVGNLTRTIHFDCALDGSGLVAPTFTYTAALSVALDGTALVGPNLTKQTIIEPLAADITGSATVTASLTATNRRVTSHEVGVLSSGVKRRFTQVNVKVLRKYPDYLDSDLTGSAAVSADIQLGLPIVIMEEIYNYTMFDRVIYKR